MENQFERTFAGIFGNTDSLIANIDNLSRGYEDYYSESLAYKLGFESNTNDVEGSQEIIGINRLIDIRSVLRILLGFLFSYFSMYYPSL